MGRDSYSRRRLVTLAMAIAVALAMPGAALANDTGAVAGHVQDGDGNSVAGICVDVSNGGPIPQLGAWSTTTDAGGGYTIGGLPAGRFSVSFRDCRDAPSLVQQRLGPFDVTPGATVNVDATLNEGGRITGHVADASNPATPVSGICVEAVGSSFAGPARTDANGDYSLGGLPAGTYTVEFLDCDPNATPSFGSYVRQWWNGQATAADADSLTVGDHETVEHVDALLSPAGHIAGHVADSDGNPAEDVCVEVSPVTWPLPFGAPFLGYVRTDANGDYSFGSLPSGTYNVTFAECMHYPGRYVQLQRLGIAVTAPETTTLDAELEHTGSISGHVTDADGNDLAGICVMALPAPQRSGIIPSAQTDANGNYTLDGAAPGIWAVEFSDCRHGPSPTWETQWWSGRADESSADQIVVSSGQTTDAVDAQMERIVAPETSITSAPASLTRSTTARIEFSAGKTGSSFECRLDGPSGPGLWLSCFSPRVYSALGDGAYHFAVRASRSGMTDQSPAEADWVVDTTAPSSHALTLAQYSTTRDITVDYASSDSSGVSSVEVWAKGPAQAAASVAATSTPASDGSGSITFTAPGDGSYTFYTRARDSAGNYEAAPAVAQATTLVDTVGPDISIGTPAADGSTSFLLGQTSGTAASFSCGDSGSRVATCTGSVADGSLLDTSTIGLHRLDVHAADNAGNESAADAGYRVVWDFQGFFSPLAVDYSPAKAGSSVPVKFSLHGPRGPAVITGAAADAVACPGQPAPAPAHSAFVPVVQYDARLDQYQFNWKTEPAWSGSCRRLVITLADTSSHAVNVKLSK